LPQRKFKHRVRSQHADDAANDLRGNVHNHVA
jgi:hypothetical protein